MSSAAPSSYKHADMCCLTMRGGGVVSLTLLQALLRHSSNAFKGGVCDSNPIRFMSSPLNITPPSCNSVCALKQILCSHRPGSVNGSGSDQAHNTIPVGPLHNNVSDPLFTCYQAIC